MIGNIANKIHSTIAIGMLLCVLSFLDQRTSYGDSKFSFALRIAAIPSAKSHSASTTSQDGKNTSEDSREKWVPVARKIAEEVTKSPFLVTRTIGDERVEILVIYDSDDITEREIRWIDRTEDRYGEVALLIGMNKEGNRRLLRLTENNLHRHVSQIINGTVYSVHEIVCIVGGQVMVGGISVEEIEKIESSNMKEKLRRGRAEVTFTSLTFWNLGIILFLLALIILGIIPSKGLQAARFPKIWLILGAIIGAIVGGYAFGFSITTGIGPTEQEVDAITKIYTISLLGMILGAVGGTVVGLVMGILARLIVRRALFNIKKLLFSVSSRVFHHRKVV